MTLAPDVLTNPLGVFYRWGGLTLNDNVTIQGTVILNGTSSDPKMSLEGDNITLLPAEIPMLEGTSQRVEIPVALIKDDLEIDSDTATINGLVSVWDRFEVKWGADTAALNFSGRLLTDTLIIEPRLGWTNDEGWWRDLANSFLAQLGEANAIDYYPQWVEQQQSLPVTPAIRFTPSASPVTYHWHDWTKPLFVAHPNDNGLVWDLIEWTDNY